MRQGNQGEKNHINFDRGNILMTFSGQEIEVLTVINKKARYNNL